MPDIVTIGGAAIATLKSAVESIRKLQQLSQDAAVNQTAIELQGAILSLQSEILEMQMKYGNLLQIKNDLEQQLMDKGQWAQIASKYELIDIARGTCMYMLKKDYVSAEPIHYLCPICYGNKKKSFVHSSGIII